MIEQLLSTSHFKQCPPVLVDIGSDGQVPPQWQRLAPYSICVAFDPHGSRSAGSKRDATFRQLHVVPAAVIDVDDEALDLHVTQSPECSSILYPDAEKLAQWECAGLFGVAERSRIAATTVAAALSKLGIAYIDWFRSDSRGLDLRLFKSLDAHVRRRILAVELKLGILDAYQGEDKLADVMAYMDCQDFWMAQMFVSGTRRIDARIARQLDDVTRSQFAANVPVAPGWAAVTYLNTFADDDLVTRRDMMLGWVTATLELQHGFALTLAQRGEEYFDDKTFGQMARASLEYIRSGFDASAPKPKGLFRSLFRKSA